VVATRKYYVEWLSSAEEICERINEEFIDGFFKRIEKEFDDGPIEKLG